MYLRKLSYNIVRIQIRKNHFNADFLSKNDANYAQLTPLSGFNRAVTLYPSASAYVYHDIHRTWGEVGTRVQSFASALVNTGIQKGDVVSIMAPNTPPIFEAHFAIPGAGAVIHTINTRLDAATIAYQIIHAESKIVMVDTEFNNIIQEVKIILVEKNFTLPRFISIVDEYYSCQATRSIVVTTDNKQLIDELEYEAFIRSGDINFKLLPCNNEWDAISLNYTSGTTGNPKGVVSHYRGAYLNALSNLIEWNMERFAKYLWIVPMFHCNGWIFPWSLAGNIGCSYFLRQIKGDMIINLIDKYKIGYLAGAPITMITMLGCSDDIKKKFTHNVKMWTAGAPPPPPVIKKFIDEFNIHVQTAYGLTETYGPCTSHLFDLDWLLIHKLSDTEILNKCTLQAKSLVVEGLQVIDPQTMKEVPPDGVTMGEVMMKGNIVMKGYLKNPKATQECFEHGWFHTGDLGVNHGNGRIELKDRSKGYATTHTTTTMIIYIIISGGENISSIEVENIMLSHPNIKEIAVIAKPDDKWGEVPCAFVILHHHSNATTSNNGNNASNTSNYNINEKDLIAWARTKMAAFQTPKQIVFINELPKTSTGKIQKNLLRNMIPKNE